MTRFRRRLIGSNHTKKKTIHQTAVHVQDFRLLFSLPKLLVLNSGDMPKLQGQDYIFVRDQFVPFTASVLIKASKTLDDSNDMEFILGGLASLNDEIAWFRQEASKWDVALSNIIVHKANQSYCRYHASNIIRRDFWFVIILVFINAMRFLYYDP